MKRVSTEGKDVHTLLVAMVDHVVTDWREDLLQIDREIIEQWSGRSFIHVARDHGTHLFLEAVEVDDNSPIPIYSDTSHPLIYTMGKYPALRKACVAPSQQTHPRYTPTTMDRL